MIVVQTTYTNYDIIIICAYLLGFNFIYINVCLYIYMLCVCVCILTLTPKWRPYGKWMQKPAIKPEKRNDAKRTLSSYSVFILCVCFWWWECFGLGVWFIFINSICTVCVWVINARLCLCLLSTLIESTISILPPLLANYRPVYVLEAYFTWVRKCCRNS